MVYRRVVERREKSDGSTVSGAKTFSFDVAAGCLPGVEVGDECTEVTVKHFDGPAGSTLLSEERHHFYHSPLNQVHTAAWQYPLWRTGKEFKTEIKSAAGQTLRRTENAWEQRASLVWWTSPTPPNPSQSANGHDAENAPPVDVRIAHTDTTLLDGQQQISRVEYEYSGDRFSNRTDVKEFGKRQSNPSVQAAPWGV